MVGSPLGTIMCPYCHFKRGSTYPTMMDVKVNEVEVKHTPIYTVAGWHTHGIGLRRCQKCKRWFAIVVSVENMWYHDAYEYSIESEIGKAVLVLLKKEEEYPLPLPIFCG